MEDTYRKLSFIFLFLIIFLLLWIQDREKMQLEKKPENYKLRSIPTYSLVGD